MNDLQCPARVVVAVDSVTADVDDERIAVVRVHRPIPGLSARIGLEPVVDERLSGPDWEQCIDELVDLCRGEAVLVVVAAGLRAAVRELRDNDARTVRLLS
ncbi:hypothetical protein ACQCX2_12165 [Propionibacteriaceae bacterium Y1700]|uniref:hypothetical protein n=1 Tax=Microlunatus sp. Y1700 TaxID=3418487 RepID=UPI003DA774B0